MSNDVTIRMRDHDPKGLKGSKQGTLRCTWRSKKFMAGKEYVVSAEDADCILAIKATDNRPMFERVEKAPEPEEKATTAPAKESEKKAGKAAKKK